MFRFQTSAKSIEFTILSGIQFSDPLLMQIDFLEQ
jgi:hypothetical protein